MEAWKSHEIPTVSAFSNFLLFACYGLPPLIVRTRLAWLLSIFGKCISVALDVVTDKFYLLSVTDP